ncbi:MAG: Flp pilus assembly protein CpaB, partial [Mesorhizobium sp.]
ELKRQKAAEAAAEADRKRAEDERRRSDEKIAGLAQAVEKVGSQIDQLSKVKPTPAVAPAPQVQEVVKEVV